MDLLMHITRLGHYQDLLHLFLLSLFYFFLIFLKYLRQIFDGIILLLCNSIYIYLKIIDTILYNYNDVQFSCSVMSYSLRPRELQHTRRPCPSPTPGVHPNSCLSSHESRWCHPTIWSSVVSFSSCPQSLPESESFPRSQLFTWGGQSTGINFSISPSKEHPGLISFRMDWLDLLAVQGLSRVFSNTTVQKHQFFGPQLSSQSNCHIHTWPQEKP